MIDDAKIAVVTGAAGFAGFSLAAHLLLHGYKVYAVLRPGSSHNNRFSKDNLLSVLELECERGFDKLYSGEILSEEIDEKLTCIELDYTEYHNLPNLIKESCNLFFHLSWSGGRDDFEEQTANIRASIDAVEAAASLSCSRFICTGSQAEYGIQTGVITEDICPKPINAYGAAKASAMFLTKRRAEQLGVEWIWGRIFSLYGLYEPGGRMLPDLISKLAVGEKISLSDCTQNWDYLDAGDAAEAIILLGEKGCSGEIYNIARGDYRPLREFVLEMIDRYGSAETVRFGGRANPYISLSPDTTKIKTDTGWKPIIGFLQKYDEIRLF